MVAYALSPSSEHAAHTLSSSIEKARQEDYCKTEANLGYIVIAGQPRLHRKTLPPENKVINKHYKGFRSPSSFFETIIIPILKIQ